MKRFSAEELKILISSGRLERFYRSRGWQELSREVIADLHGECVLCRKAHKLTKAVLVHHVKPLREYPNLAYSRTYTDDDGEHIQLMPLCFDCHERIHGRGKYSGPRGYTNEEKW